MSIFVFLNIQKGVILMPNHWQAMQKDLILLLKDENLSPDVPWILRWDCWVTQQKKGFSGHHASKNLVLNCYLIGRVNRIQKKLQVGGLFNNGFIQTNLWNHVSHQIMTRWHQRQTTINSSFYRTYPCDFGRGSRTRNIPCHPDSPSAIKNSWRKTLRSHDFSTATRHVELATPGCRINGESRKTMTIPNLMGFLGKHTRQLCWRICLAFFLGIQ